MKVIVGAGQAVYDGWESTNIEDLDLLKPEMWRIFFQSDGGCLDAILAEAVWEHMAFPDGCKAAETCYRFLRPGGYVRVAVPDGYHPDKAYIDYVSPPGFGHKFLYNYHTLSDVFELVGFRVNLLEWWDERGQFYRQPWDDADGVVLRAFRNDERNADGRPHYTMLILDAMK